MSSVVDTQFLIKYIKHSTDAARRTPRNRAGHLNTAIAHQETEDTKPCQWKRKPPPPQKNHWALLKLLSTPNTPIKKYPLFQTSGAEWRGARTGDGSGGRPKSILFSSSGIIPGLTLAAGYSRGYWHGKGRVKQLFSIKGSESWLSTGRF